MQTNSLINSMYNRMTIGAPEPTVGMGATITHWTDRDAATVVYWDGKIVGVQEDRAERTDGNGMSDSQCYQYSPWLDGPIRYFRRDKHGAWRSVSRNDQTGRWALSGNTNGLILGRRDRYYDYSF